MGRNSVQAHGAEGRSDVLKFKPDQLVLEEDPGSPYYDERVLLPVSMALVDSIREHGCINPVRVVRDGDRTVVVAGRQRVKAIAYLASKGVDILVPAQISRGDDGELASVAVHENEHRSADTPLVRARKMQRLLNYGRTEEQVARAFGLASVASVKQHVRLLDLSKPVQNAVDAGRIGVTSAVKELAMLPRSDQAAALERLAALAPKKKSGRRPSGEARAPRMRTRVQVAAAMGSASGDVARALAWVLGEDNGFAL